MKQFFVLTLFPEMIEQTLSHSIMGRAQKEGHISVEAVNIRDFTQNKHRHVDDYPYGGGAGLVMDSRFMMPIKAFCRKRSMRAWFS